MMLETGDILETEYGTGPYRVTGITRDCTCVHYVDWINGRDIQQPRHMHIVCILEGDRSARPKPYYLNGYAEQPDGTIRCVRHGDELKKIGQARGVQMGLGL